MPYALGTSVETPATAILASSEVFDKEYFFLGVLLFRMFNRKLLRGSAGFIVNGSE